MLFLRLQWSLLAATLLLLASIAYAAVPDDSMVKNNTLLQRAHAKDSHPMYSSQQLRLREAWYGNILFGAGLGFTGKSQTLTVQTGIDFGYDAKRGGQAAYLIAIGGGHSFVIASAWDLKLGMEADYIHYGESKGIVRPLINVFPDYNTLDYSYKARAYTLMVNLGVRWWSTPRAFIEGYSSFGVARNALYNYEETPSAGSTASPMQAGFQRRSSTSPALSVGVAFGYQVAPTVAIEIGYRYINTRHAAFRVPNVSTLCFQSALSAGNLSAQLIYFNLLF